MVSSRADKTAIISICEVRRWTRWTPGYVISAVSCTRNDRFATCRRKARGSRIIVHANLWKTPRVISIKKKILIICLMRFAIPPSPPNTFSDVHRNPVYLSSSSVVTKYASLFERQISLCHSNRKVYFWNYLRLLMLRQSRENNTGRSFDLSRAPISSEIKWKIDTCLDAWFSSEQSP